ncbi:FG-GAP repeat domain-containing protein [Streptomyces sp. NPDC090109]|uniref:FG-GAP repeat domain-containing protein n=1 Tax=unclassified Streptomyces TaxID=2593676 RepID=UPI00136F76C7|nr:VCBS repeat-containing protein [Streptomyces sp. SID5770]MZE50067.1 VCBS repeat-containing protein [Streptomyces sp. SID5770]
MTARATTGSFPLGVVILYSASSVPGRRRRLTAAVATALAVTLGAGVLAGAPATAATAVTAKTGTTAAKPVALKATDRLDAVGATGFVSGGRWYAYADGGSLPLTAPSYDSAGGDVVATGDASTLRASRVVKLHDMGTGAAPVAVDLGALNARYVQAVGPKALLAQVTLEDGSTELRLVTAGADGVTQRKVAGVPAGKTWFTASTPLNGSVAVQYFSGADATRRAHYAVVDTATAEAVSTLTTSPAHDGGVGLSATHVLAATTKGTEGHRGFVALDRATGEETAVDLGLDTDLVTGLTGSWATYATRTGLTDEGMMDEPHKALVPLRARSLANGETVRLLDHVTKVLTAPDGSLIAEGGTTKDDEGFYRIAVDADGKPAARLVASKGVPTEVVHRGTDIPYSATRLDRNPTLKWRFSRVNIDVHLTLRNRATGTVFSYTMPISTESAGSPYHYGDNTVGITWARIAELSQLGRDARSGVYEWTIRAVPQNGVGPDLNVSGSFQAGHAADLHDIKQNGGPSLIVRDPAGQMKRIDTRYDAAAKTLKATGPAVAGGGGWGAYDRIEAAGDVNHVDGGDVVARDRDGFLWLHEGGGSRWSPTFTPRKRVGDGWNTYARFTGGSDLNGDGLADLVAVDAKGDLYLHASTADTSALYRARKKIGHGWGIYDRITAVGNVAGAAAGDLVARDKDGVLWLHLGRGDGTFAPRTRIGGGWNAYADVVGIGDADGDRVTDLLAHGPNGTAFFYKGTDDWKAPFAPRVASPALNGAGSYDIVS